MARRKLRLGFIQAVAASAVLAAGSVQAQSIGWARMPSTIAQYFGVGYGAGHHAPIVRTPLARPERVPRREVVWSGDGPLYPAPYAAPGYYGVDWCAGAPAGYPAPQPTTVPYEAAPVPVQSEGPMPPEPLSVRPVARHHW